MESDTAAVVRPDVDAAVQELRDILDGLASSVESAIYARESGQTALDLAQGRAGFHDDALRDLEDAIDGLCTYVDTVQWFLASHGVGKPFRSRTI